jgi:hypothetical protein
MIAMDARSFSAFKIGLEKEWTKDGSPPTRHKLCQVSVAFKTTVLQVILSRMTARGASIRYTCHSPDYVADYMVTILNRTSLRRERKISKRSSLNPPSEVIAMPETQEAQKAKFLRFIQKNAEFVKLFDQYMTMTLDMFGRIRNKTAAIAIASLLSCEGMTKHVQLGGSDGLGDHTLFCTAIYEVNSGDIPLERKTERRIKPRVASVPYGPAPETPTPDGLLSLLATASAMLEFEPGLEE